MVFAYAFSLDEANEHFEPMPLAFNLQELTRDLPPTAAR